MLVTDPQNDFLSEQGVTWQLFGDSVRENNTVENIERLIQVAKSNGYEVFISPHYYYPTDHGWKFEGTLEKVMHDINMFDRPGALSLEGFNGSGADELHFDPTFSTDGVSLEGFLKSLEQMKQLAEGVQRPVPSFLSRTKLHQQEIAA